MKMTSGSWRRIERRADANVTLRFVSTWICVMPAVLMSSELPPPVIAAANWMLPPPVLVVVVAPVSLTASV